MEDAPAWHAAHAEANAAGHDGYFDPATGLFVMTRGFHERRGSCCSSECRHCPFDTDVGQPKPTPGN